MTRSAYDSWEPAGFQQLTVSTTGLALTVPATARWCLISANATNGLRFRDDGTDPTAAIGVLIAGGANFTYLGDPRRLKVIREGGADAVINVAYYK